MTASAAAYNDRRDVLLRHATIIDGSGREGFEGDIFLCNGRIAEIGDCRQCCAEHVIDASGLYACPGFIDPHGHSDFTLLADPRGLSKMFQGITTEACGQCGMSAFPVPAEGRDEFRTSLAYIWAPVEVSWRDAKGYLGVLASRPRGLNMCPFLGANTAVVEARETGRGSFLQMEVAHEELLPLWGISLGLGYEPFSQWPTDALKPFARAAKGKVLSVHLRNEGSRLLESIEEAIALSRAEGVRVEIAHLKAALQSNWGKIGQALARIEEAYNAGVPVGFNVYPYTAGSTFLAATLPSWLTCSGHVRALQLLRQADVRARLRDDWASGRAFFSLPPEHILIAQVSSPLYKWSQGLTLAEVATRLGMSAFDAAVEILIANNAEVTAVFFTMSETDMIQALAHPLGSICTDGLAYCPDGPTAMGKPHPRSYGAFPRFLGRYVRDQNLMDWPEAIRKCTSLPASRLGLADRGLLREGYAADLVLFDPTRIMDLADYRDPHKLAVGVEYVIVNGVISVARGEFTGALGGRVLTFGHA